MKLTGKLGEARVVCLVDLPPRGEAEKQDVRNERKIEVIDEYSSVASIPSE
jgi:hypothetical protein